MNVLGVFDDRLDRVAPTIAGVPVLGKAADLLVLTEIYAAGEDRLEGITGEALYEALKRRGHADKG